MAISMQQVKELRDRTQAGLNDCKNALGEAEGDMEKAVELILKKGLAKSAKRAGAAASEGIVKCQMDAEGQSAVLVEVNIQTDFAARNDDFLAFADKVTALAASAETGADLGALQDPDGGGTIEDVRKALVGKLGENINVRRWDRLSVDGGLVHAYIHMGGKIGALIAIKLGDAAAKDKPEVKKFADDIAMQIAAMAPQFVNRDSVDPAALAKQSDIFDAQLKEEGKPDAVRPKIVEGKINKWMKEICLVEQPSVLDGDKTVQQLCEDLGKEIGTTVEITGLVRYERGEGVEVPEGPDFAEEARKMAGG